MEDALAFILDTDDTIVGQCEVLSPVNTVIATAQDQTYNLFCGGIKGRKVLWMSKGQGKLLIVETWAYEDSIGKSKKYLT